jgi:hypothetical protein
MDTPQTMEIAGITKRLIDEHQVDPASVAFDAGGGGKQIADRLIEQDYWVQMIGFGEGAEAKQAFKNRRAELYGTLRDILNPDREDGPFSLPSDCGELRQELGVLPLQYDSEGRLYLPPKNSTSNRSEVTLRSLLGRSPDRADSLVLAVWALQRPVVSDTYDGPIVYYSPGDPEPPLTAEELENADPFYREIIEGYDRRAAGLEEW